MKGNIGKEASCIQTIFTENSSLILENSEFSNNIGK